MAGNYPALGDLVDAQNVVVIEDIHVEAFNINGHPTLQQVSAENDRLRAINRPTKKQRRYTMTDDEHGAAVVRHHAAATARLNHELGIVNPNNVGPALEAIQQTLNDLQANVVARLNALENGQANVIARLNALENGQATLENGQATILARLDTVEAGMRATMRTIPAREANSQARKLGIAFVALPKWVSGHPAFVPQPVTIHLAGAYAVGADPPLGLLPTDSAQLDRWAANEVTFRRRLRTIYWFYNEPRLHIPGNANKTQLIAGLQNLVSFLRDP